MIFLVGSITPTPFQTIHHSVSIKDTFPAYLQFIFDLKIPHVSLLTIAILLGLGIIVIVALWLLSVYLRIKKELKQKYVLLEIQPPSISLQSAFSTKELFSILHSLDHNVSFLDRKIGVRKPLSYEIASSKEEGIRYLVHLPEEDVLFVTKTLRSYIPSIVINKVSDYIPDTYEDFNNQYSITEFKFKKSFVLPLEEQDVLNKHDPIAYITGQMTKLEADELVALQVIETPVTDKSHGYISSYIYDLSQRIYKGKEIVSKLRGNGASTVLVLAREVSFLTLDLTVGILKTFADWTVDFAMASPNSKYRYQVAPQRQKDVIKELTPRQRTIQEMVEKKIQENLFEVTLRLYIKGTVKNQIQDKLKGITASFTTFNNPGYQSLKQHSVLPFQINKLKEYNFLKLKHRLLSLSGNPILSVSELASIYHFPYTQTTQTEDIMTSKHTQLPAPLSLKKSNNQLDIVFASNIHGGTITPIGLNLEERRRHLYVIGATGMGKTTLLSQMIYQDIANGKGLAILDPHGDLAERLLGVIPQERIKDVVYFNPYDLGFPIGLNILELTEGLSETEEQREKDMIVSSLVSIFFKLYPSPNARPRMEHVLRNTVLTALTVKKPTLLTVYKILVDKTYRKGIVEKLEDPVLKDFWKKEFETFGSYQKADLISALTNKLGRFLTTKMTRNILTQEKSKLNFEEIMNNGKILICDLSKGKIGEDISSFLGSLLIVKIQLAALNRVHTPQDQRKDFFLYIDEFQNFATMTFAQILSEARKYRLNTILAHQTISQIEDKDLLKVILANVGTVIAFRTSNPSDEDFILPLFKPQVKENEISNLPAYNFYIKINALLPQDTFTGITENFLIKDNSVTRKTVIETSQKQNGNEFKTGKAEVEMKEPKPAKKSPPEASSKETKPKKFI